MPSADPPPQPHEAAPARGPSLAPFGGDGLVIGPIHGLHFVEVSRVRHAVEQVGEPIRVQLESRRFLPKPLAEGSISPAELGIRQLAHEQKHQLALLQCGKRQVPRPPLASLPPCWRRQAAGIFRGC